MRAVENRQAERASNSEQRQRDSLNAASTDKYVSDSLGASSQMRETHDTAVTVTDEVVVTTTREYDTDKPLGEQGLPPLKKETTEMRHRQKGKVAASRSSQMAEAKSRTSRESAQSDTLSLVSTTARTQNEQAAERVESEQSTEDTQHRGLNGLQNALCWIGGIVLLVLVCYLVLMIVKRKLKVL